MQRNHRRLILLHGFLGSPDDWEAVISHLPDFECLPLSYPFQIPKDGIVVGYSMGGRIALRCSLPKIVLSAHPGLKTSEEKTQRWASDQQWIERLKREPLPKFLEAWYAQPLFNSLRAHPVFSSVLSRRQDQNPLDLVEMFAKESLAHQTFHIPPQTMFIHGQLDTRYAQLYRELNIPSREIPGVGHAAHLENPQLCAEAIREQVQELVFSSAGSS